MLEERVRKAYEVKDVVLDLGQSAYITRTFLRMLIQLHRDRARRNYPPVTLVAGSAHVQEMLGVRIQTLMPVYQTLEAAIASRPPAGISN